MKILLILLSVLMICAGQILFKLAGQKLATGHAPFSPQVATIMVIAFAIYGAATLLWVYVLRSVELTKAYPFMALSFVVVPALSIALLSERVTAQYVLGTVLIVAGVIITARA